MAFPASPTNGQTYTDANGVAYTYVAASNLWRKNAITGSTNLAVGTVNGTTVQITSDTGADATIPAATGTAAGVMPAADKVKTDFISVTQAVDLDAIESAVANLNALTGVAATGTNLGTFTGGTIADNSTLIQALQALETAVEAAPTKKQDVVATIAARDALTGMQAGDIAYVTDASADATVASGAALYVYSGSAWAKIAEFESLDVTATTNLGIAARTATALEVTSSSGTSATLPAATTTLAGLMTAADKSKLDTTADVSSSATAPASPTLGDEWFNTADSRWYKWTTDGSANFWVDISG